MHCIRIDVPNTGTAKVKPNHGWDPLSRESQVQASHARELKDHLGCDAGEGGPVSKVRFPCPGEFQRVICSSRLILHCAPPPQLPCSHSADVVVTNHQRSSSCTTDSHKACHHCYCVAPQSSGLRTKDLGVFRALGFRGLSDEKNWYELTASDEASHLAPCGCLR